MKGYIVNSTPVWLHALKRAIGPGGKVSLEELYEQYGVKHNLEKGQEFIEWLSAVKLRDKDKWKVILEDTTVDADKPVKSKPDKATASAGTNIAPMVGDKMSVNDIIELSVRQARETLPKVKDLKLLRYSLQEANQRAGKDSLCKLIRNRIKEIQIAR